MAPLPLSRALAAVVVFAALLASGCKGDPPEEKAAAPARPIDVMDEVAKAKYDPPADGRLTEEQVEMFIAVKQREREIREASVREIEAKVKAQREGEAGLAESMAAVGDVVGLTMADLWAALELGHNPKEYAWVRERMAEAEVARANAVLNERVDQNRAEYLAMLAEEKKAAATDEERAAIDRQVEEFRRRPGGSAAAASPAVRHNMALLAKYDKELLKAQLGEAAARSRGGHEGTGR